jgi:hypothetical protein
VDAFVLAGLLDLFGGEYISEGEPVLVEERRQSGLEG